MTLKQKVYQGFAWTGLQGVGSQLISFGVFLVLARLLDPEAFGLVAMATVIIAFLKLFSYFGFGTALIQRQTLEDAHLNTAFWVDTVAALIMMIATIFLAEWLSSFFGEERLVPIIKWLSILFMTSALSQVQTSLLRKNLQFKALALRNLVAEIMGGVVGIILAFNGFGVWALVFRHLTTSVFNLLIIWLMSDWTPGLVCSFRHFKDLFSFSVNMMGAHIVGFLSRRSDSFLIGYFLGPVALGYYTIAYRLIELLIEFLGGTVNKVAWPAFAKMQGDLNLLRRSFYTASNLLGFFVFPIYLGILSVADQLVPLTFGAQWHDSIPVLQILTFIGIMASLNKLYDSVIVSLGRPGIWLCLKLAIGITNVVAFLVSIQWGIVGVAMAYTVVGYLYFPVYLYLVKKISGISILAYLNEISAACFSSAMMVGVVLALKLFVDTFHNPYWQLFVYVTSGAATYLLVVFMVSPGTLRQLKEVFGSVLPKRTV